MGDVRECGAVLHYTNGQWSKVTIPATGKLNSVAMLSANEGWAVGDKGAILHYQNGTWQKWQQ